MRIALYILVLCLLSCGHKKEESRELVNRANTVYLNFDIDTEKRIDSALTLVDSAIILDDENFQAYLNKATYLVGKRDIEGLLVNNLKMIALKPGQPHWKAQRGIFLELTGDLTDANKLYNEATEQYEEILKSDTLMNNDINFRLEYITALQLKGDSLKIRKEYNELKVKFPNNEILEMYDSVGFQSKEKLFEVWNETN